MLISVIIPVVDEATVIGACLRQFNGVADVEVLVVDGGSTDGTRCVAAATGVGRWLSCPERGRARQMNFGAASSLGEGLLFLHADTLLPPCGLDLIRSSLANPETAGGRFRLRLSESGLIYRLIGWLSTLRSRFLGITYGDQAIFARRGTFRAVGGFPDRLIFEDSELATQLSGHGRFVLLDAVVRTSARRWRRSGILRTILLMYGLRFLYALSVSDSRLSRWHRNVR